MVLDNEIFTICGQSVALIDLLCALFGLTCVYLAGRNNKNNFWVGYAYTILLFFMFAQKHLYSSMILQPISLVINVIGHYRWTHPRSGEESQEDSGRLKVSFMKWRQRGLLCTIFIVCYLVWGTILKRFGVSIFADTFVPDPQPYLDSFVTMLILVAQYLSAQKKWDCWIVWLLVNITNLVLYLRAGLIFMPIVCILYIVNGVISLRRWFYLYKQKN